MIDYSSPQFKSSEVARAAGIEPATFRSYFKRGQFRVIGPMDARMADSHGLPNLFSLRDALAFAVAAKLISSANIDAAKAFETAVFHFAHIGDEDRDPARTFSVHEFGRTCLIYHPDSGKARLEGEDNLSSIYSLFEGSAGSEAAVVIILNPLEHRVFAALGIGAAA